MFDNNQPPADQSGAPQSSVVFKVGDREYDPATAAVKIEHADKHISTLEQELKTLREQLSLTEAQKKALEALSHTPPATPPAPTSQAPAFDMDDLLAKAEQRVFDTLSKQQQAALAEKYLAESTSVAKQVFGDNYQQELLKRGSELGMDQKDIVQFASTKPDAFKRLFGLNTAPNPANPAPASSYSYRQAAADTPVSKAVQTLRDSKATGRQRTDAIAEALRLVKP